MFCHSCILGSLTESVDSKSAEGVEDGVTQVETGGDARRFDSNWESLSARERGTRSKLMTPSELKGG